MDVFMVKRLVKCYVGNGDIEFAGVPSGVSRLTGCSRRGLQAEGLCGQRASRLDWQMRVGPTFGTATGFDQPVQ